MNDIQEGVNVATEEVANTEVVATPQQNPDNTNIKDTVEAGAYSEVETEAQVKEDRYEKAFAARLAKEKAKIEAELTKKYSKHDYVLTKAAAENELTVEEYLDTLEKDYRDKELAAIPKEIREDVLWAREKRANETKEQQAKREEQERTERWNTEVQGLVSLFPDIKSAKDIPDEVLEWRAKDNVPLEYAYAKYALGKERTKIEQETLKKLRENEMSSVGSMASTSTDTKVKIADMDDKDFEKLMEEVKRGTRKSL